jgi:hypothetical protein
MVGPTLQIRADHYGSVCGSPRPWLCTPSRHRNVIQTSTHPSVTSAHCHSVLARCLSCCCLALASNHTDVSLPWLTTAPMVFCGDDHRPWYNAGMSTSILNECYQLQHHILQPAFMFEGGQPTLISPSTFFAFQVVFHTSLPLPSHTLTLPSRLGSLSTDLSLCLPHPIEQASIDSSQYRL